MRLQRQEMGWRQSGFVRSRILTVLDVMMPELDGFSTCREIKKLKDIPVIMLSARGEEYDRIHGFETG